MSHLFNNSSMGLRQRTGTQAAAVSSKASPPSSPVAPRTAGDGGVVTWRGLSRWLLEQQPATVIQEMNGISKKFVSGWKDFKDGQAPPSYMRPELAVDLEMYGEMVNAVYDTLLTKNVHSPLFGGCMPNTLEPGHYLSEYGKGDDPRITVSEAAGKYKVVQQVRADSGPFKLVVKKGRNYMGIIAQGPEEEAPGEPGVKEFDVAIAFRGTVFEDEWKSNAKAMQVAWKKGCPVSTPPTADILNGPVFDGNLIVFAGTFMGSLVLLNSPAVHWFSPDSPALAPVIGVAAKLLGGLVTSVLGVPDQQGAVSFSALLGLTVYGLQGFWSALSSNPKAWLGNVVNLVQGALPWAMFLTRNLISGIFTRGDALFSYGFKEMYCDAKLGLDKDGKLENPPTFESGRIAIPVQQLDQLLPPSPRLMVFRALNQLMKEVRQHNAQSGVAYKKRIKSITVTGHSLGGALAGVCGYDLSTTIKEALEMVQTREPLFQKADDCNCVTLYSLIDQQRAKFMRDIRGLARDDVPAVGVVTFAAPRVGDDLYAAAFKGRAVTKPLDVGIPLRSAEGIGGKVSLFSRDTLDLLFALPWWAWSSAEAAIYNKKLSASADAAPPAAMLRVVNVHDVVPDVPPALPFRPFRYVHGGYELLLNSLFMPYLKSSELTGASITSRHTLEVYLHLANPDRDRALMNKGGDVLRPTTDTQGRPTGPVVPVAWWDPVPNHGMKLENGKWTPTQ